MELNDGVLDNDGSNTFLFDVWRIKNEEICTVQHFIQKHTCSFCFRFSDDFPEVICLQGIIH